MKHCSTLTAAKMRRFGIVLALMLPACTQVSEGVVNAANSINTLRTGLYTASSTLANYRLKSEANPQPQLRYCYKRLTDIVCYDAPQPGGSPLVGVQEGVPGRIVAGEQPITEPLGMAQNDVVGTGSYVLPVEVSDTEDSLFSDEPLGILPDNAAPDSEQQEALFSPRSVRR